MNAGYRLYVNSRPRRAAAGLALAAALLVLCVPAAIAAPPAGFQETTAFSGLSSPTVVRFAQDGRVFVAEQNGRIKMWDNLFDPSATVVADLGPQVHSFWDRGLLGFALDPQFPTRPYLYASYAHDAAIGGTAPRWGDACPTPPGATGDGCVISGRLSKLTLSGETVTNEQVLVEDWCQQYPSHSVGALAFGADNALYMTAGDGASFNFADYGQDGNPLNPCGDPPGGVGGAMTIPSAEGGALRSQDLRTSGDPVNLDGSVIRVNPDTGAGLPNNPLAGNSDANARRIIGQGLRNPFRFTVRPGTNELWIGDVGWNTHEEINRIVNPLTGPTNFGWPCREGGDLLGTYRDLSICQGLESQPSAYTAPYFSYRHSDRVVAGETCPTGSSSIAGLAFYNGGSFPSSYNGALFFSDYSRRCIWVMFAGTNGLPDPATRQTFNPGAAGPVDLAVGPGGDLFYADLSGGTIRRIRFISDNQPPVARASANPTSGTPPLAVNFSGSASSDPDAGDTLIYEWDLDGDGAFDDSTSVTPSRTYTASSTAVRLRVTDSRGVSDTSAPITITTAQNTAPQASIDTPAASLQWRPGQQITFTGSATDAEDGSLGAAALSWTLDLHHCALDDASNCHVHRVQEWNGDAGDVFSAPDHEYPSYLELTLTARDSFGVTDVERLRLDPQTVQLSFASSPPGLQLSVGGVTSTTPFTRTVIRGSTNSISAPTPQSSGGQSVVFSSWSDGGARSHDIVAPDSNTTYTATYAPDPGSQVPGLVAALGFDELAGNSVTDSSGTGNNGTILGATRTVAGRFNGALSFDGVNDWVTIPDSPSLDMTQRADGGGLGETDGRRRRHLADRADEGAARQPRLLPLRQLRQRSPERLGVHRRVGAGHSRSRGTRGQHLDAPGHDLRRRSAAAVRERDPGREPGAHGPDPVVERRAADRRQLGVARVVPGPDRRGARLQPRAQRGAGAGRHERPCGRSAAAGRPGAQRAPEPHRHRLARPGGPQLGRVDGQRGRGALQRAPLGHRGLHALGGQPGRPGRPAPRARTPAWRPAPTTTG